MTEYEFKYGRKPVEQFLDAVLSIEEHIDPNFFIQPRARPRRRPASAEKPPRKAATTISGSLGAGEGAATPPRTKSRAAKPCPKKTSSTTSCATRPHLEDWQRDVIAMIHEEMEYFVPQMQTKTMNEGWACATGDSLLVTEDGFVRFDELYDSPAKRFASPAADGDRLDRITDFHKERLCPPSASARDADSRLRVRKSIECRWPTGAGRSCTTSPPATR